MIAGLCTAVRWGKVRDDGAGLMDQELNERIQQAARYCLGKGLSVIPLAIDDKKPAIRWGQYADQAMGPEEWTWDNVNVGLVTGSLSGVVVVDCDSAESYEGWLANETPTPMRVRSKRGMHFYYRHPGEYVKSGSHFAHSSGFKYDIKGDRSYVMFPPSMRGGHQYQIVNCKGNIRARLIPPADLPPFDMKWRPEIKSSANFNDGAITDGLAYIRTFKAVAGQGGHNATYRAVCKLRESGLDECEALAALCEWNMTNADPQWSHRELLHKVRSVYGDGQ